MVKLAVLIFVTFMILTCAGFLFNNKKGGSTTMKMKEGWRGLFAEALSSDEATDGSKESSCLVADQLMENRGPENYRKALQEYKTLLDQDPQNPTLKLKVADASLSLLRALTNANAVLVDGISDSNENRKLWSEHAPLAYSLLKELHEAQPDDARLHILMTEAFTYRTSAKGIVKAAVTGDGLTFMRYVDQIVQKYPTFDAGVSYIFRGAFLLAAPWPLRNIDKAMKSFESALQVEPRSLRNNYYVGVSAYHGGQYEKAREAFDRAITTAEPLAPSEIDVADFFRRESKRSLLLTQEKLQGQK